MTAESSASDDGAGDGSPRNAAGDDRPPHEIVYAQTMARFAQMYDDWSKVVDAVLNGRDTPPPPPEPAA
jgi:hypothetical protein